MFLPLSGLKKIRFILPLGIIQCGVWDVETVVNSLTVGCRKALHCLSIGGEGSALIVAGGADSVLRIWDQCMPGTLYAHLIPSRDVI